MNNGHGECNIVRAWTEILFYIRKGNSCINILRGTRSRERAGLWNIWGFSGETNRQGVLVR